MDTCILETMAALFLGVTAILLSGVAVCQPTAQNHFQQGLSLSQQGRLHEAIPHFTKALELDPRLSDAAFNLSLALLQTERPAEALAVLDKHPAASADYFALKGAVLNALGRSPEAAQALRRAVAIDPNNPDTLYDLVLTLLHIDGAKEAETLLARARPRFPKEAKIHAALGMVAYLTGKNEQALRAYQIAVKLEPDAADFHASLGDVYDATGELAKAESAYARAVKLDPSTAAYFLKYGRNQVKLQKSEQASALFKQALKLDPRDAAAHFELGKLAAARNDDATAVTHFEQAVAADPSMKQGWYQLALSYRRAGLQDKSTAALEQYRKLP